MRTKQMIVGLFALAAACSTIGGTATAAEAGHTTAAVAVPRCAGNCPHSPPRRVPECTGSCPEHPDPWEAS